MKRLIHLYPIQYWPQQQNILVVRYVFHPLTHIFIILINLVYLHPKHTWIFNRQRKKIYREIDIIKRVTGLELENANGSLDFTTSLVLIGVENLLGSLRRLGQMLTWPLMKKIQLYTVFKTLVQPLFLHSSPIGNYSHKARIWRAVYAVYFAPRNLPELRWKMFRSRNTEGESLLPTRATILPHIMRAYDIALHDKSYTYKLPSTTPYWQKWKAGTGNCTVSHFSYAPLIKCKITRKRNVIFLFWDYQRKAHLYLH